MKKGVVSFIFVLGIFLSFSFLNASFSFNDNYFIETNYGPQDTLKGWIEIGLDKEPSNSTFESSEGDTATLMTLINADPSFIHDCNTHLCASNYEASNSELEKTFTLNAGESKIIGLKIEEGIVDKVDDFSLKIGSDAGVSDFPQLEIDVILNDEKVEWQSYRASGTLGAKNHGCYTYSDKTTIVQDTELCGRMTLSPTPEVKIGAYVTSMGDSAETTFEMTIKDGRHSFENGGSCQIPVSGTREISCTPENFRVNEEKDFFVCISKISGENYLINYETSNACGFAGIFDTDYDFEIFVQSGEYAAVGEVTLDTLELVDFGSDLDLEFYIENYIDGEYEGVCPLEGCIVPIKFTSMIDSQTITISDAVLSYEIEISSLETNDIYDLTETPAEVSADLQELSIDSGRFSVPNEYGNHTIFLSFGDKTFSEQISVERVPEIIFVKPLTTAASYPTTFTVEVSADKDIDSYGWIFGDGDTEMTTTNEVEYTYDTIGTYEMEVRVIDSNDREDSKNFTINVGSAFEITGLLLQENKVNLGNVQGQLSEFSEFEQEVIEETLDIGFATEILDAAEIEHETAVTEEDYQAILQTLIDLNIPESISLGFAADSIFFYPEKTNINVGAFTEITGEDYEVSKEDQYASSILGWHIHNVDITITYKGLIFSFENYAEPLNFFEVDVTKKAGSEEDSYIVLKEMEELIFGEDYSYEEESGYIYMPLVEESKKIIFATSESVNFIDLPLFVSPEVSQLTLVGFDFSPVDESGKLKKWVLFSLVILLLFILGIIFWVFLHAWYKKKYENYLFKNKNNLYNLFTWIENAKKRGLGEKESKSQLRKAGWNSEQLRYALRKHGGKKTGMPDIPIKKIIQKSKKKRSVPQRKFPGKQQPRTNLQQNPGNRQPRKRFYNPRNRK